MLHRMPSASPPTDPNVTNSPPDGTNSGADVTSVPPPRDPLRRWVARLNALPAVPVQLAVVGVPVLLSAAIGSASVASDLVRRGIVVHPSEPWIWEFSSAASILIWLLPVLWMDERLRASVANWATRLGVRVVCSIAFSLAHVATMVALRHLVYALAGWHYDFGPWLDGWVYEYRKDVMTYALIVGLTAVWRTLAERDAHVDTVQAPPAVPPGAPTFLVRTTTQGDVLVRAQDIDWVEAQGNYVALHTQGDARLMRQTLSEMEARLVPHGFIRTHRRALVNRARVQAIIPPELGELGVRLMSGQIVPLSESRRTEVLRLVLGEPASAQRSEL